MWKALSRKKSLPRVYLNITSSPSDVTTSTSPPCTPEVAFARSVLAAAKGSTWLGYVKIVHALTVFDELNDRTEAKKLLSNLEAENAVPLKERTYFYHQLIASVCLVHRNPELWVSWNTRIGVPTMRQLCKSINKPLLADDCRLLVAFLHIIVFRADGVWRPVKDVEVKGEEWATRLSKLRDQLIEYTNVQDMQHIKLAENAIHYNVLLEDEDHVRNDLQLQRAFRSHETLCRVDWWNMRLANSPIQSRLKSAVIIAVKDEEGSMIITVRCKETGVVDLQCDSMATAAAVWSDLKSDSWNAWCASSLPPAAAVPMDLSLPVPALPAPVLPAPAPVLPASVLPAPAPVAINSTSSLADAPATVSMTVHEDVTRQLAQQRNTTTDLILQLQEARDALRIRTQGEVILVKRQYQARVDQLQREIHTMQLRESDSSIITLNILESIGENFQGGDTRTAAAIGGCREVGNDGGCVAGWKGVSITWLPAGNLTRRDSTSPHHHHTYPPCP